MMTAADFKVGEKVLFGRRKVGRIVKKNPKTAKIEQLEERGTVGEIWTVPYSLLTKAEPETEKDRYGIPLDRAVECYGCGWEGQASDVETTLQDAADLNDRLDPGCVVPYGECPECGAFCYLTD